MTRLVACFGIAVRQTRRARGWSQEELAGRSELNRSYVGEIERGLVIVSLATIEKLARALEVAPSALVMRGEAVSQDQGTRSSGLVAKAC